jgi:hypothetical protein
MMLGNGMGTGWEGLYTTSLLEYHSNWRTRADELSDTLKISMLIGQYHLKHTRGRYYAKAQNLSRQLRDEFNKVFRRLRLAADANNRDEGTADPVQRRHAGRMVPTCVREYH